MTSTSRAAARVVAGHDRRDRGTSDRLYEHYSTLCGRASLLDPTVRGLMYRSFRRTLRHVLPRDADARILDVGCGPGGLLLFLEDCGYADLQGFDISPENVELCREAGLGFVTRFDALELEEWPDEEPCDVIFAMDLLEHLPKEAAAGFLQKLRERLRPGGYAVIQTPNLGSLLGTHARYFDLSHEFGLTEKSARDLLRIAGFGDDDVEVMPSWNAATALGRLREVYLGVLHRLVFLAEDSSRPRVPTKNLLIRARRT